MKIDDKEIEKVVVNNYLTLKSDKEEVLLNSTQIISFLAH